MLIKASPNHAPDVKREKNNLYVVHFISLRIFYVFWWAHPGHYSSGGQTKAGIEAPLIIMN